MPSAPEPAVNFQPERQQELETLEEILLPDSDHGRIVGIHGAPGSGKSALVHEFLRRHRSQFPGGYPVVAGGLLDKTRYLALLGERERSIFVIDEVDHTPIPVLTEVIRDLEICRPHANILTTSNIPILVRPHTYLVETLPLSAEQIVGLIRTQAPVSSVRLDAFLDALTPLLSGNAEAAELVSRRLASGVPMERIMEWFESGKFEPARTPTGQPLAQGSPERKRLDLAISEISEELIRELAGKPELLYDLAPRKFEELIAELYRRRGFEATLTPASGDEGADVYVVSHNDLGRELWVVQAKRNAPQRRVEAGVVRELLGTVSAKNASAGVLITTSFFQPGAKKLERNLEYRLSLKDYLDLQQLLRGTP